MATCCVVGIADLLLELGLSESATDEERALAQSSLDRAHAVVSRILRYDPCYATRTEWYTLMEFGSRSAPGVWDISGDMAVYRQFVETGTEELQVRRLPIRVVDDLRVDYDGRFGARSGAFPVDSVKTIGEDFWPRWDQQDDAGDPVCHDGILRSFAAWPTEPGSVQITYTAGYTAAELRGQADTINALPIFDAILQEAARRVRQAFINMKQATGSGTTSFTTGPITSERMGDYSYTIGGGGSGGSTSDRVFGSVYDALPQTKEALSDFINWGWPLAA